jgi:hypothetical protein
MKKDRSEYIKNYHEKNKDKIKAQRDTKKEERNACSKAYQETDKDGFYTVYYLPEEHYAGMTTKLSYRLGNHKSKYNRYIDDVEIIGKYEARKEALRVEAALHTMGYLGRHPRYKQQTLKQLL